jgi:putative Mg2+ transporter-C (MgtC) family protein
MAFPTITWQTALLRLGLAVILGALIGLERERGERAAGMRTLALVSLGSALFMVISAYGFSEFSGNNAFGLDPSRIAAQVVTGIGFLGAGTILLRRRLVRGLTTAAAIWAVAAIGLACGIGQIVIAIIATVLVLIVLVVLRSIEGFIFPRKRPHVVRLRVDQSEVGTVLTQLRAIFAREDIVLETLQVREASRGEIVEASCRIGERTDIGRVLTEIRNLPGVHAARFDLATGVGVRHPNK